MSKITVTLEFTIQPASGPNLDNRVLEVLDVDSDRFAYIDTEEEAVEVIRKVFSDEGFFTFEIDLDGLLK